MIFYLTKSYTNPSPQPQNSWMAYPYTTPLHPTTVEWPIPLPTSDPQNSWLPYPYTNPHPTTVEWPIPQQLNGLSLYLPPTQQQLNGQSLCRPPPHKSWMAYPYTNILTEKNTLHEMHSDVFVWYSWQYSSISETQVTLINTKLLLLKSHIEHLRFHMSIPWSTHIYMYQSSKGHTSISWFRLHVYCNIYVTLFWEKWYINDITRLL